LFTAWDKALLLPFFLLLSIISFAQQKITFSDTVISERNNCMPGVSAMVKGSLSGTTTHTKWRLVARRSLTASAVRALE
jgi:hypothetical protein